MRIGVDLDGTICELRKGTDTYTGLKPLPGAVERLQELRDQGHEIIIMTARRMGTSGGNPSLAVAMIGRITMNWLARYKVPFDEIHFGKPNTYIYIDDRCVRFEGWDKITDEVIEMNASEK